MYLNPTDALHGDLGIVRKEDLIVLFSKSGNTEELVRLVPYAKVNTVPESFLPMRLHLCQGCSSVRPNMARLPRINSSYRLVSRSQ